MTSTIELVNPLKTVNRVNSIYKSVTTVPRTQLVFSTKIHWIMLVSGVVHFYHEKRTKPINIIGLKFNIEV